MEQIRRRLNDDISIHALCEEGDDEHNGTFEEAKEFLSTPSARRATRPARWSWEPTTISIHALCEEGDRCTKEVAGGN